MPWLHHTVIHIVIGLSVFAPLLAIWRSRGDGAWTPDMRAASYAAAVAAMFAVGTGLASASHVVTSGLDASRVELHRNAAIPAAILVVATAVLAGRNARRSTPRADRVTTLLAILAAVMVSMAAHLGGDMLHPGLAPWSHERHMHGHDHDHDPSTAPSAMHPEEPHSH